VSPPQKTQVGGRRHTCLRCRGSGDPIKMTAGRHTCLRGRGLGDPIQMTEGRHTCLRSRGLGDPIQMTAGRHTCLRGRGLGDPIQMTAKRNPGILYTLHLYYNFFTECDPPPHLDPGGSHTFLRGSNNFPG
jgi:hypothetical protein